MKNQTIPIALLICLAACAGPKQVEQKTTYSQGCSGAVGKSEVAKTSGKMVSMDQILTGENLKIYSLDRVALGFNGPGGSAATIVHPGWQKPISSDERTQFCGTFSNQETEFEFMDIDPHLIAPSEFNDYGRIEGRLEGKIHINQEKARTLLWKHQSQSSTSLRQVVQGVQARGGEASFQLDEQKRELHLEFKSANESESYTYRIKLTYKIQGR